jgi:hypothetical protein
MQPSPSRQEYSLRQRFTNVFAVAGLIAVFCLGLIAARVFTNPLDRIGQFLSNPFGFSTKVTPSGPVVLQQIQQLSRLETTRYRERVIVKGDTKGILPSWVAGDRILFVGQGEVVAGIDLTQLQPGDVRTEGTKVSVHLPPAKILHTTLDNRQSEVYERQTGIFSKPDPSLETKVRIEAEDRIRAAALESGVLKTAEANSKETLRPFLNKLGFDDVHFD